MSNSINLDVLTQDNNKTAILLAELAGLLHNIGKLDPNFLADVISRKNSTKRIPANNWISSKSLTIPQYAYKRFSAPDASILSIATKQVMSDFQSRKNPSFLDFCGALKSISTSPTEIQAVIDDRGNAQQDFPLIVRSLDAIWQFFSFTSVNNGPLYLLLPDECANIENLNKKLSSLSGQIGSLSQQVKSVPDDQKKIIGKQIQEQKKEQEESEKELKTLFDLIQKRQKDYEEKFRSSETQLMVCSENWAIADLLTLFWDKYFFYKPNESEKDYKRRSALSPWLRANVGTSLPALLILSHGEISGSEKESDDEEEAETTTDGLDHSPEWKHLCQSTAFGLDKPLLEIDIWPNYRKKLLDHALLTCTSPANHRNGFLKTAKDILSLGVGDSQWPINDVDLLSYASSIATLFKSAVAKAVLEKDVPTIAKVKWQLLSVRYDGLEYLSRAQHISDLLARRELLQSALDEIQSVIEFEYPLGNEIYRDENGSILIVPDIVEQGQPVGLLNLPCGTNGSLAEVLLTKFSTAKPQRFKEPEKQSVPVALDGEVKPLIELSGAVHGKEIKLPQAKNWKNPPLQTDSKKVDQWWKEERVKESGNRVDICTVCGLRPQGYGSDDTKQRKKAADRKICHVCMERRDDRSKAWAQSATKNFEETIWVDEVADNNGRIALVVGRFMLDGWLDGSLIPTMQKSDSFARIQRCWRTTETFWQEIKEGLPQTVDAIRETYDEPIPDKIREFRPRLTIIPQNLKIFSNEETRLGKYHSYELGLGNVRLSVVWDDTNSQFITCENLDYFCSVAGIENLNELQKLIANGKTIRVYEPSSYLVRRDNKAEFSTTHNDVSLHGKNTNNKRCSPFIPVIASPSSFMVLVPADKAVDVVSEIKKKYEKEMGKVRDRLPIHTGIVFAPHRTPIRALLNAGRRLLKMPDEWEKWTVKDASVWDASQKNRNLIFTNQREWAIPMLMGDDKTPDDWYPYFLIDKKYFSAPDSDKNNHLRHARDLHTNDSVQVRPSLFDFEFLSSAAQRFEVSYKYGKRRSKERPARPYYLEEIDDFKKLWDIISNGLTTSQIKQTNELIEAKRREWFSSLETANVDREKTFNCFVEDALYNAGWKKDMCLKDKFNDLLDAAVRGQLADVIELNMQILKLKSKVDGKESK